MVNISYRSSATHVWCVFPVEIQVTDIQGTRNKDIHTISALYSVARVSWRPQNRFHVTRLFCCCVDIQFVAACAIVAHSYWTIWLQFGTWGDHSYHMLPLILTLMMLQVCHSCTHTHTHLTCISCFFSLQTLFGCQRMCWSHVRRIVNSFSNWLVRPAILLRELWVYATILLNGACTCFSLDSGEHVTESWWCCSSDLPYCTIHYQQVRSHNMIQFSMWGARIESNFTWNTCIELFSYNKYVTFIAANNYYYYTVPLHATPSTFADQMETPIRTLFSSITVLYKSIPQIKMYYTHTFK